MYGASQFARSLGIPALFALDSRVAALQDGLEILLDADSGLLNSKPDQTELDQAQNRQEKAKANEAEAMKSAFDIARTPDGRRVEVHANISGVEDAKLIPIHFWRSSTLASHTLPDVPQRPVQAGNEWVDETEQSLRGAHRSGGDPPCHAD